MKRLFIAILIIASPAFVQAQESPLSSVTADELVDRLRPAEAGLRLRGLTITERATEPSRVDLAVEFGFDSAELTDNARALLSELAAAMQAETLKGLRFRLGGHTDAVGRASYNLALSKERARAVRDFLTTEHSVDASRLDIAGYGMTRLLFPERPEDARNRRVEIVTLD